MSKDTQQTILSVICAVALALTFFASGLVTCCLPITTQVLAGATCAHDISPFTQDELIRAAEATRSYTVDEHDEEALYAALWEINERAAAEGRALAGAPDLAAARGGADAGARPDVEAIKGAFAGASESYVLPADAVAHLDDVSDVIARFTPALLGIAVLAAFCLMATLRLYGARPVGRALTWAGAGTLAALLLLGLWALIGFDGFFAAFHGLFFADGTWTFPSDSLLICMYPTAFWMGMGGVWLATSCALSILSLALGLHMLKRRDPKTDER
ncbi:DUF1461 domain-containing protein [Adlercreutzia sp. ZJ242]|uniref:lipoprotein intramolecular transacylase Lit n=1 Tax=Adlercreutzia sp. ZJ242 TaxID=2709409 RepID=UPI0013EBA564|nr:DUF1461 domain-containing protein [Adlercreutzia sp. ZJ242]